MSDLASPTCLPWRVEYDGTYARKPRVYGADGRLVAEIGNAELEQDRWEADAHLLVTAVNILENDWLVRLSASEYACYRWPEDTTEHRAMRGAFMDGFSRSTLTLPAAEQRTGWQPIETAPADQNLLLGWWREWPALEWACTSGLAICTKGGWKHGQATHWHALPECSVTPPNRAKGGE